MSDRFDVAEEERASHERARRFLAGEGGSGEAPVGFRSAEGAAEEPAVTQHPLGWTDGGVPTSEGFGLRTPIEHTGPGARHDPEHPSE
jgi:hypothetical protein